MAWFRKYWATPTIKNSSGCSPSSTRSTRSNRPSRRFSDEQLPTRPRSCGRYLAGEALDDLLPEAFAAVREAAKRTLGQRHFDVQLMGGMVLHQGKIAEMKTGEGKTLVATLPAYLNALTGEGVHLVTVNDYLAKRDAGWNGRIFDLLGMTTGCIVSSGDVGRHLVSSSTPNYVDERAADERLKHLRRPTAHDAYAADITYGTNNEFGFDYLRDNLAQSLEQCVQRASTTPSSTRSTTS